MALETIRTERVDRQFRITIDRPDKPNPIGDGTLTELEDAVDAVERTDGLAAVVVSGEGNAFATGADLDELADWWRAERWERLMAFVKRGQDVIQRLDRLSVPTIAAIDGYALGGGLELALACDLRFATERSRLGFPEVGLGMLPAWGGTQRLPGLVGESTAIDLILTGRRVDAAEAEALGMVDRVVAAGGLWALVDRYVGELAEQPSATVAYALEAIRAGRGGLVEAGLAVELRNDLLSILTDEARERTQAFLDHG